MTISAVQRDEDSAEFFDGTAQGVLKTRQCENGHFMPLTQGYGGAAIRCHTCRSENISWAPVSGDATLVSWVVVHARDGSSRMVAGIVELAEGPWMQTLIDVDTDAGLRAGAPLTVGFVPTDGREVIPVFRRA
jgi:uncharacterized protein